MRRPLGLLALIALGASAAEATPIDLSPEVLKIAKDVRTDPGELPRLLVEVDGQKQPLPLRHTHVFAEVSTHIARVDVVQTYKNDFGKAIEAVYVFPLPENSAVDDLKIEVGGRVIVAEIQERSQAQRTYRAARRAGHTAALLEQERPNVFTQSVANIPPGEEVKVMVRFVQHLSYDEGLYEWAFPMVVGPRYIPGAAVGKNGAGWSPDTDAVPDASRITPPIIGAGTRTGHDFSLEVVLDSALPVTDLQTPTHRTDAWTQDDGVMTIALADDETLPNRDFVLRYRVDGETPQVAVQAHKRGEDGHFALTVQPPHLDVNGMVGQRELVFVVDVSGSMSGRPLALAKASARLAIGQLRPVDTFNIYTFAGATAQAFSAPRPANEANIRQALQFVDRARAGGGTRLAGAVQAALSPPVEQGRHRYVVFLTDGYVGNEGQIFAGARDLVAKLKVRKQRARVFALGTGSSVNRHLITGLAEAGRGFSTTLTLAEDPAKAVRRLFRKIDAPVLRDVIVDWGRLDVQDIYPEVVPDVLASRPLVLHGRYETAGQGTITVRGITDDGPVAWRVPVVLPEKAPKHGAIATLWARAKVEALSQRLWDGHDADVVKAITETGLKHRLVTAYTSFVAVDRSRVVGDGKRRTIAQPTEVPDGVDPNMAAPAAAQVGLMGALGANAPANFEGKLNASMSAGGLVVGHGSGGMGMRGVGVGGGGYGAGTIGLGSVGTVGRGRGATRLSERRSRAPKVISGKVVVTGSLDKSIIRRVLRRNRAAVRYCYEKQLQKNPKLSGKLILELVIEANGTVKSAKIVESTVGEVAVADCLMRKARRFVFPAVEGGGVVVVRYPYVFRPTH